MFLISLKNIRFLAYLERTSRGSRYSWKLNPKTHKWHYERVKTRIHLSREQKNSLYKIIIKNKKQKTRTAVFENEIPMAVNDVYRLSKSNISMPII